MNLKRLKGLPIRFYVAAALLPVTIFLPGNGFRWGYVAVIVAFVGVHRSWKLGSVLIFAGFVMFLFNVIFFLVWPFDYAFSDIVWMRRPFTSDIANTYGLVLSGILNLICGLVGGERLIPSTPRWPGVDQFTVKSEAPEHVIYLASKKPEEV